MIETRGDWIACLKLCNSCSDVTSRTVCKDDTKFETINEYLNKIQQQVHDETIEILKEQKGEIDSLKQHIRQYDTIIKEHYDQYKQTVIK